MFTLPVYVHTSCICSSLRTPAYLVKCDFWPRPMHVRAGSLARSTFSRSSITSVSGSRCLTASWRMRCHRMLCQPCSGTATCGNRRRRGRRKQWRRRRKRRRSWLLPLCMHASRAHQTAAPPDDFGWELRQSSRQEVWGKCFSSWCGALSASAAEGAPRRTIHAQSW